MDTLKLKAFLAIAKHGSFSKAADEFMYTPSAFSHLADGLEQELGVTLFIRNHQGVKLTKQGEGLKEKIEQVLIAENELKKYANSLSVGEEIKIVTYSSISLVYLPQLLTKFKVDYPSVKFSIVVLDNIKDAINSASADVYFSDVKSFTNKLEWFPIIDDEYVAVVPSDEFKGRKSVKREELYAYSYIKTNESGLSKYFDENSFKEIINYTSVEDFSIFTLVSQKMGITITNSLVAKKCIKGTKALKIAPPISRTIGVGYNKEQKKGKQLTAFINFVKNSYSK